MGVDFFLNMNYAINVNSLEVNLKMLRNRKRPKAKGALALNVLRYLKDGRLKVSFIRSEVPIMIVMRGIPFYQKRLYKDRKGNVTCRSARSWLSKGGFLVPIWKKVFKWEIDFFLGNGYNLVQEGIHMFEGQFSRLVYMQVADLSHTHRQIGYVIDRYANYMAQFENLPKDITEDEAELLRAGRILSNLEKREFSIKGFYNTFRNNLLCNHDKIDRAIAVVSNGNQLPKKENQNIREVIDSVVQYCRAIKSRPMYRRLYYAGNSLELAKKYLVEGNLERAKARLESALKNLIYPTTS